MISLCLCISYKKQIQENTPEKNLLKRVKSATANLQGINMACVLMTRMNSIENPHQQGHFHEIHTRAKWGVYICIEINPYFMCHYLLLSLLYNWCWRMCTGCGIPSISLALLSPTSSCLFVLCMGLMWGAHDRLDVISPYVHAWLSDLYSPTLYEAFERSPPRLSLLHALHHRER